MFNGIYIESIDYFRQDNHFHTINSDDQELEQFSPSSLLSLFSGLKLLLYRFFISEIFLSSLFLSVIMNEVFFLFSFSESSLLL